MIFDKDFWGLVSAWGEDPKWFEDVRGIWAELLRDGWTPSVTYHSAFPEEVPATPRLLWTRGNSEVLCG